MIFLFCFWPKGAASCYAASHHAASHHAASHHAALHHAASLTRHRLRGIAYAARLRGIAFAASRYVASLTRHRFTRHHFTWHRLRSIAKQIDAEQEGVSQAGLELVFLAFSVGWTPRRAWLNNLNTRFEYGRT